MALAYPDIKFTLINNDKKLLSTTGDGDLLKVIYNIYGIEVAKKVRQIIMLYAFAAPAINIIHLVFSKPSRLMTR